MNILVVGYGSIGQRHARLLSQRGHNVRVVTSQSISEYRCYASTRDALLDFTADAVVVCKATFEHAAVLDMLASQHFTGRVLVEKPLLMNAGQYSRPYDFPVHVAYQLRFHPVIAHARTLLQGKNILGAHIYVGQHLDSWRPGRATKDTYSARAAQGGGVVRDLSHEIDLVQHLFGTIRECKAIIKRAGDVTVDAEDIAVFALSCQRCPAISMQINYLDRMARREWIIITDHNSLKLNLIEGTVTDGTQSVTLPCERDTAYLSMHAAWLSADSLGLCSFEEGLEVVRLIDALPAAA